MGDQSLGGGTGKGRPPAHSRRKKANLLGEDQVAMVRSVVQAGAADQGELRRFRGEVYDRLDRRAEALIDGICAPVTISAVVYLSLAPGARRGHGAAYAAVSAGRIDEEMLRDVLAAYRPQWWRPDFAVDASVWARCDAECSPQRGFFYHPSRHSAGQPIVAGWCYSWLVALSAGGGFVDSAAGRRHGRGPRRRPHHPGPPRAAAGAVPDARGVDPLHREPADGDPRQDPETAKPTLNAKLSGRRCAVA